MKNRIGYTMKLLQSLKLGVLIMALALPLVTSAQSVLPRPQTGTLQGVAQDDGYLVISGTRFGFDNEITRILLAGEVVESTILDEGLVVRYTVDNRGTLVTVEVIGPNDKIRELDQN